MKQTSDDASGYLLGVDVGTGSARAGLFTTDGRMVGTDTCAIAMHRDGDSVEQSSEEIWQAVVTSVRGAIAHAEVTPRAVKGIGFDATCSLVVLGPDGAPTCGFHGSLRNSVWGPVLCRSGPMWVQRGCAQDV